MGGYAGSSLKTRMAAVTGLLFLAGIGLILFFLVRLLHEDMQRVVSKQQLTTASYIARDIEGKVQLRLDSLKRVASNVPAELIGNPEKLQVWLEDRRAIHTLFPTGLMIIPPDGGPTLAETPRLKTRPKSFVDRDWFQGAVTTLKPYVSKPLIARATGEPALVVAVPLLDQHQRLLGVLAGVTPLATPGFLDLIIGARPGRLGSYQLIYPAEKLFVLGTDIAQAITPLPARNQDPLIDLAVDGLSGIHLGPNREGEQELASIVPIRQTGWWLLAREPAREAFEPVSNTVRNALLITLVLALPLLVILLAVLSRLLQPFARLAQELHAMAEGTRPMHPVTAHSTDEVADVADSFNRLQQKLLDQEKRLQAMAHHDALTGLPNRLTINDRLESELLRVRRNGNGLALLFLDLDGFKPVNDTHGHPVGDRLLIQIAQRLQACVRDIDTVARLGGDEFLILLSDTETPVDAAERVAQQCLDALAMPFRIDELRLTIGVSIGIAIASGQEAATVTAAQLAAYADLAMYQAKAAGRGCYRFYSPAVTSSSDESANPAP